ncbi:MAG: M14 family zinc carboxypeptidase [Nocardioidaceae bacterium]
MHGRRRTLATAIALAVMVPPSAGAVAGRTDASPDRMQRAQAEVIGRSVQGRPIRAWHLGDPDARRTVVVMAAMHGNELAPRRILGTLRKRARIRGVDLWVVPTVNPDGARRHHRKNARGVDLNRNYPVRWKRLHGSYDSGPRPRSEPETRVMMRFLRRQDPRYVVSFHQPLHGVDATVPKTSALARRLAVRMHLPRKSFTCGGHCHGTMTQWFNKRRSGAAVTVELGPSPSRHYLSTVAPKGLLRAIRPRR